MSTFEVFGSELIKFYLAKSILNERIRAQIREVIDKTRQGEREIGGGLFTSNDSLEIRVTPSITDELDIGLEKLKQGDYSYVRKLYDFASNFLIDFEREIPYSEDIPIMRLCTDFMDRLKSGDSVNEKSIEAMIGIYRLMILERAYSATYGSFGITQNGFVGTFHTHPNGSEPSPVDIAENVKNHVPCMVISPQKSEHTIIYGIWFGKINHLYEGRI